MTAEISRRALLGGVGALTAAALTGCSTSPSGGGGGGGTGPSSALVLPTQVPLDPVDGAVTSKVPGVTPGYRSWPSSAAASVAQAPGDGGELTTFQPTWGVVPPPIGDNQWGQAVQERWKVSWQPNITLPAQNYAQTVATRLAGGDLPDILWAEWTATPAVLQGIQQGAFADLTPYLSGDAVLEFPNLAKLPTYAWQNSALMNKLWIIPNTLSTINQWMGWRQDWVDDLGVDGQPTSVEEFFEIAKSLSEKQPGGRDCYAFTTLALGNKAAGEMFGVSTQWEQTDGTFTATIETDAWAEAIDWCAKAWQAGLFHPDAASVADVDERNMFQAGKTPITWGPYGYYYGPAGNAGAKGDIAKSGGEYRYLRVPAATDAGISSSGAAMGFWGGGAISSAHEGDEVKMRELLRILDYWAAPFGSQEFLLMHFGVEGRHFTFEGGQPTPTTDAAVLEELNMNVMTSPAYLYFPGAPDAVDEVVGIMEQVAPDVRPNASWGLVSETNTSKQVTLNNMITDATRAMITGAEPTSTGIATLREQWAAAGGSTIKDEFKAAWDESNS